MEYLLVVILHCSHMENSFTSSRTRYRECMSNVLNCYSSDKVMSKVKSDSLRMEMCIIKKYN